MVKQSSSIEQIENYLLLVLLFLYPIVVLSSVTNSIVTPKVALMSFGVGILLLLKAFKSISKNRVQLSSGNFDLPIVLLAVIYVASAILQTPNKMEAFFLPGTATIVVTGALLYFVTNQLNDVWKSKAKLALFGSSVVFALFVLFATAGVFRSIPQLPAFMKISTFTPTGGALPALIFLLALLPLGVNFVIKEKEVAKKAFLGVSVSLVILASLINLLNVLPGKTTSPQLPGFATSWSVAVDSLKASPLLGMGPGNYLTAFNRFRPLTYNQTDLWSVRFTSGQSFLFTGITETGLAGAAAILILLYSIYKMVKTNKKVNLNLVALGIITGAMLLFPTTPTLLFTLFALLALNSEGSEVNLGGFMQTEHSTQNLPFAARIPTLVATVPMVIFVLVFGFYASRVLAADVTYRNAIGYIAQNDGRNAYSTLQSAISQNPYIDRYHVSYAQVNIALANSIAQNENISDQDRNTIAQLIQQAIREGKSAVALNPTRAGNWEVLASIYRSVIPLAQGADSFAVQTYNQAVALDPLNPNTRIALGGVYYGAGAYENAIDVFNLAVLAKPNHANARFNLASAYRENGQTQKAIDEMSLVLSLVDKDSDDYKLAKQALEDLQNKRKTELESSTNLTTPQAQEQVLEPPIELPSDAQPPATPSPSPSPSAAPTATPEASASPSPSPLP